MNSLVNDESSSLRFIEESNRIEGIERLPTPEEFAEYTRFMALSELTVREVENFVSVYQPGAQLRIDIGMNVHVGLYTPPAGCITIKTRLMDILNDANMLKVVGKDIWDGAYNIHHRYESLHPFMDGNGRSGRMIWRWMVGELDIGFLHWWYYQSLSMGR